MKIYVAGPLGFTEVGRAFHYQSLIPTIRGAGFEPLDPWGTESGVDPAGATTALPDREEHQDQSADWGKLNAGIAEQNVLALDSADGVVAVLDGADVDSGTAAEIGYAFARGLPILGYRGDRRLRAENPAAIINLQVEYFIYKSGGAIVRRIEELPNALERMMTSRLRNTRRS